MGTFSNSEDTDEIVMVRKIFRQIFENNNLITLDMYNGLSQVYCIKPEGIIH